MAIAARPGTVIGGAYRLDRVLGEGGMGVVWAAHRLDTLEPVALKFIKEASGDPEAHRRLLREARAASAVRHPHVVAILEVLAQDDGAPAIVMELLEGESLVDKLRRAHSLSLSETAALLLPVVSGVGTAHSLGIVHRDLKPENIFLTRGPGNASMVKVLDFGIAKLTALDGEAARTTGLTTTAVLGTPAYMSPEQVFGERDIDHRADIWALGLIVYQCLTGVLPTAGNNVGQVLKNVLARPIPSLRQSAPGLPAAVASLVDRMLCRGRDDRPADLREVHAVLARHTEVTAPDFGPPLVHPARPTAAVPSGEAPPLTGPAFSGVTATVMGSLAMAAQPPARPPGRRRRLPFFIAVGVVCATAAGTASWWPSDRSSPPQATVSPLESPSSVLACPPWRAEGVDQPAGWLGAAAAATACERARVILGGAPGRTLVPAELLGLPRQPEDGFPRDPFAFPEARKRALEAARRRAAAYFDGEVVKEASELRVSMTLHASGGAALARSTGRGRGLYEAIRDAMAPLVRPDLLPRASVLDPVIGEWSRATDVDGALAQVDFALGQAHNAGGLPEECARVEQRAAAGAELAPLERWICAYTLGLPAPSVDSIRASSTSPGAIVNRALVEHLVRRSDPPEVAARLGELLEHEATSWGRSHLAAALSCLLESSDPKRARETALLAIQAEPKNPDGQFCGPWGQLLAITRDTASDSSTVRAMQAWVPWDGNGWLAEAEREDDPAAALAFARRAYVLTPFDAHVADVLAGKLLAAGEREQARSVALALGAGGHPVHRVESELLLVRIDASEARFGAALARARRAMLVTPRDVGWVRVQRLEIAWRGLGIAQILGRAPAVADAIVEAFLTPEPPPLDEVYRSVSARIPAICALASPQVSRRCFSRYRALRARLSGGILPDTDAFIEGAEAYAVADFERAAKAWRPLVRDPGLLASTMTEAIAEALERTGDVELVERVDAVALARARELNGATPAHVRAARRAAARGQKDQARALAKGVIEAWSAADETVPAVEEMRTLLLKLK